MGHRPATRRHRLDEVSQAQLEPKIPAHAQNDDSAAEVSAGKQMVQVLILAMANFSHSGANIAAARHRLLHGLRTHANRDDDGKSRQPGQQCELGAESEVTDDAHQLLPLCATEKTTPHRGLSRALCEHRSNVSLL